MLTLREAQPSDAEGFLSLLLQLDQESNYMLYEVGERKTTIEEKRKEIEAQIKDSLLIFAEDHGKLVGYLSAERGFAKRINHSAYIIIGIIKDYGGKGIGKAMFERLDQWALKKGITRLELTVMTCNARAVALYQRMGFKIEGVKERSCLVEGQYLDEYYMGKLK